MSEQYSPAEYRKAHHIEGELAHHAYHAAGHALANELHHHPKEFHDLLHIVNHSKHGQHLAPCAEERKVHQVEGELKHHEYYAAGLSLAGGLVPHHKSSHHPLHISHGDTNGHPGAHGGHIHFDTHELYPPPKDHKHGDKPAAAATGDTTPPPPAAAATGDTTPPPPAAAATGDTTPPPAAAATGDTTPPPPAAAATGDTTPPPPAAAATGDTTPPPAAAATGDTTPRPAVAATGDTTPPPAAAATGDTAPPPAKAETGDELRKSEETLSESIKKLSESGMISDAEAAKFRDYTQKFELRKGLSPDEIKRTIDTVNQLLEKPNALGQQIYNVRAAEGIIFHAANPDSIKQGQSGMCSAISIGNALFLRKPSVAADMIMQAATKGSWQNPANGQWAYPIALDTTSILPNLKEKENLAPWDQPQQGSPIGRSYAAHLLGEVIFNDIGQHFEPKLTFKEADPTASGDSKAPYGMSWWNGSNQIPITPNPADKQAVDDPSGGPTAWEVGEELQRLMGTTNGALQSSQYAYTDRFHKGQNGTDYFYASPASTVFTQSRRRPAGDDNFNDVSYVSDLPRFQQQMKDHFVGDNPAPLIAQIGGSYIQDGEDAAIPDHFVTIQGYNGDGKLVVHNPATGENASWSEQQLFDAIMLNKPAA